MLRDLWQRFILDPDHWFGWALLLMIPFSLAVAVLLNSKCNATIRLHLEP